MVRLASNEALQITNPSEVSFIDPSLVISIAEKPEDVLERRRAENHLKLGATALESEVYVGPTRINSLKDAIDRAETDPFARRYLELCASTDVVERIEKVEYIAEVQLEVDENREIHSAGQTLKQTQLNSWNYASSRWQMAERVKAENRNVFRLQREYRQGNLEDNHFIEISLAADNLDNAAMIDEGFFADTMSLVLRDTTTTDGVLTVRSAFVAGVKNPWEERHDLNTIVRMGKHLGIDLKGKTVADIIDNPLLISKKLLPGGIIDLVKLFDEYAGGTFFGQNKPVGDYEEVVNRSRQRDLSLRKKVTEIADELIRRRKEVITERDATKLLNQVSGKHMISATKDTSINARVFGPKSEEYIISARLHYQLGNYDLAEAATQRAIENDASRSCPGAVSGSLEGDVFGNTLGDPNNPLSNEWHGGKIIKNAKCRSCHEIKGEVGACRICKDCVGKLSKAA